DRFSYAALCYALAEFDVRRRLPEISLPLLAVAGSEDQPTPATKLAEIAGEVPGALLEVIEGAAHLGPIEAPAVTAALRDDLLRGKGPGRGASGSGAVREGYAARGPPPPPRRPGRGRRARRRLPAREGPRRRRQVSRGGEPRARTGGRAARGPGPT